MLDVEFSNVYTKFKLHFYQKVFSRIRDREASLTTVEAFCMEIIQALNKPTVNEFANFINISPPNAAYKVNSLVKKGYLTREQSDDDKREFHLCVTEKYNNYYNISYQYLATVMDRIEKRFSPEDVARLEKIAQLEQKIDDMTDAMRQNQLQRMHAGADESAVIYSELLTDFERIGDHILNIGEAMTQISAPEYAYSPAEE